MHRSRAPSFPSRPGRARRQPRLRNGGKPACRPIHIAADLDLTRATVTCHLRRLRFEDPGVYEGRRAIVATLGGSGVRVSELCAIRMRDLRLHAASGAHFRIPDAKTEAGVREVQVSPDLVEEMVAHVDALRRVGLPTDPDAYLFSTVAKGGCSARRSTRSSGRPRHRRPKHLVARGLPELGNTPCGGRTSRSRFLQTASTCFGSCVKSDTPTRR